MSAYSAVSTNVNGYSYALPSEHHTAATDPEDASIHHFQHDTETYACGALSHDLPASAVVFANPCGRRRRPSNHPQWRRAVQGLLSLSPAQASPQPTRIKPLFLHSRSCRCRQTRTSSPSANHLQRYFPTPPCARSATGARGVWACGSRAGAAHALCIPPRPSPRRLSPREASDMRHVLRRHKTKKLGN